MEFDEIGIVMSRATTNMNLFWVGCAGKYVFYCNSRISLATREFEHGGPSFLTLLR